MRSAVSRWEPSSCWCWRRARRQATNRARVASGASQGTATPGGTIFILNQGAQWDQTDPQRVYTGEDLAFFGATLFRGLVSFTYSPDTEEANKLTPDLATDTGTPNADATEWSFTLRDGATFEDGSPVTCEDVKYGVSRTFATDVINQGPTYQIAYLDIPPRTIRTPTSRRSTTGRTPARARTCSTRR